jgi:hypothetical protein
MAKVLGLGHNLAFAEEIVHAAIDPRSGRLYVVFTDGRFTGGGVAHVSITSSKDLGQSWTRPVRVNEPKVFGAWLPSIAVSNDGRVGVTYYETDAAPRHGIPCAFTFRERVFRLDDEGNTKELRERLIDLFDFMPPDAGRYFFMGDYFGLVAIDKAFHAVYVKTAHRESGEISADVFFGR